MEHLRGHNSADTHHACYLAAHGDTERITSSEPCNGFGSLHCLNYAALVHCNIVSYSSAA